MLYSGEEINESSIPLRILGGLVTREALYGGCHCTYVLSSNRSCGLVCGGVQILRVGEDAWHGAFLCEKHARELNLLW